MLVETPPDSAQLRPSRVVAEALVRRHGPQHIADRAAKLGCCRPLTNAMIAACTATAIDYGRTKPSKPAIAR